MSNFSHRGYEQRTEGAGRRRHKATGFNNKPRFGTAAKCVTATAAVAAAVTLVYLFADNISPFIDSFKNNGNNETVDTPTSAQTADTPDKPTELPPAEGEFDSVDKTVFVSDGAGYGLFKGIDTTAKNYSAVLNSVSGVISSNVRIYNAVIPTNTDIGLNGSLSGSNSQRDNLDVINGALFDRISTVDLYSALYAHRDEYVYFRTDESLTALGGYYSYLQIAEDMGISSPYSLQKLSEKKYSIAPFEGGFITRTTDTRKQPHGNQSLFDNPDTLEYYKLPVHYDCFSIDPQSGNRVETDLFTTSDAEPLDVFVGRNHAQLNIYNLQADNTDKALIVKDSAASPILGYLIPHYSEVYVIDTSLYSGTLTEFIHEYSINDVLFINGIDNANNSLYCQRLRDLFDNSISD